MENLVLYKVEDRICTITLNRIDKRNALNPTLVAQLTQAFEDAANDNTVKVVLLKGAGKAFSAGADLEYLQQLQDFSFDENIQDCNNLKNLFHSIYTHSKIVIAVVQGHAIAGGCGLATICDFVYAVPEANFGYTEVKLGFVPALVSIFLTSKLAETKAKELLFTGNLITSSDAKDIGLINEVIEADLIEEKVQNFAKDLIDSCSGNSLTVTKKLLNETFHPNLEEHLEKAVTVNATVRSSDDFKNGIAAFLNKETIRW